MNFDQFLRLIWVPIATPMGGLIFIGGFIVSGIMATLIRMSTKRSLLETCHWGLTCLILLPWILSVVAVYLQPSESSLAFGLFILMGGPFCAGWLVAHLLALNRG